MEAAPTAKAGHADGLQSKNPNKSGANMRRCFCLDFYKNLQRNEAQQ